MATPLAVSPPPRWELAAENIAVKIRWFGLLLGFMLANGSERAAEARAGLNAILALGVAFTLFDSYHSFRGRVFLGRYPLVVSSMEALFIGLLCYLHDGLDSPFRFYYFLSLICCAIRYPPQVTYLTCALHCASLGLLYLARLRAGDPGEPQVLLLTLVVLAWVTWASSSLALLLKRVGDHLGRLNGALQENQTQLEARIAERTGELQEAQAHVLHQEQMATFGLLAAGIAHEVGNPLTAVSNLVQMLQARELDGYASEKLNLVNGQLQRIQTTLRELIHFSRPASPERVKLAVGDVVDEAINVAKYYKRTKGRLLRTDVPAGLPPLVSVRDQLVQIVLNLVLNAIDATDQGGRIDIAARQDGSAVEISVRDDGHGIAPEHQGRLFQPYFTTKKHGTGLGLFVTRRLVADLGGAVDFASRPEGGTVFRVRLPLVTASVQELARLHA